MIHFTTWDIAVFLAGFAFIYVGLPLLVLVAVLLAIPASRRHTGWRRLAYGILAFDAILFLIGLPVIAIPVRDYVRHREFEARTHHLSAPATYGGIAFPGGSTVHLADDGTPEFGSLPVPTPVLGLVLVGDFRLGADYGVDPIGVKECTLAVPADIQGIPCGPGAIKAQKQTTRCVLARDWLFAGHMLAAGHALEIYRSPLDEPPRLTFGTLARPELLYGVRWPAGTLLGGTDQPPERMVHGPASGTVELCLPSGLAATIPGAVLHGFLSYHVAEGRRRVSPVCSILPNGYVGDDGFAQVGPDRYDWGDRPDATSAWHWTTPFHPPQDAPR